MPGMEDASPEMVDTVLNMVQRITGLGKTTLIKAKPFEKSSLFEGAYVVKTEPMDKFVTYERFMDEMIEFLKCPTDPMEDLVLKSVECKPLGDDSFETKVMYDKEKIKRYMRLYDGPDVVRTWNRIQYNYKDRTIRSQEMRPKPDNREEPWVYHQSFTIFTQNPLTIEFYMLRPGKPEEEREIGKIAARILQDIYLNPICCKLLSRKVDVDCDQDSIAEEGELSVLTGPLDEWVCYDEVYDGIYDRIVEACGGETTIATKTETETKLEVGGKVKAPDGSEVGAPLPLIIEHDRETCILQTQSYDAEGKPILRQVYHVHQCPLRVEMWLVEGERRLHGKSAQGRMQGMLDVIISRSNEGWFY